MSPRRIRATIAATVGLLFFGLITHGHFAASGDAVHYLIIAHSVAFDGDLDLANDYADPARLLTALHEQQALPGRDGVLRPVHDIGLPVIAAPLVGLAYRLAPFANDLPESWRRKTKLNEFVALRQLTSLLMIAVTATLAVSFFGASWRLTGMKAAAFGGALLWALSPPIQTHGYVFFTEIPTALLALAVYVRLDSVRASSTARGLLLGVLTGLLLLIHVRNIGLVLVFAFLVLWRLGGEPRLRRAFLSGLAGMFAIKIALNWWFWGTWLTTPHEHFEGWPGLASFTTETAGRVFGLLFDARHGLLFSAPIYLLVPAALILLARRSRGHAVELCLIVLAYLFFVINPVTNFHGWRGGWSPAARFLVPVTPFLAMGLPLLLSVRRAAWITAAVVLMQVVVSAFQWGHPILTFSEGPGPAPWLQRLLGPSMAAGIPVWETLTPALTLGAVVVMVAWMMMTRWMTEEQRTTT